MSQSNEDLKDALVHAEERVKRLQSELENVIKDRENLSKLIDSLLGSLSWKITKPLRTILGLLRKIKAHLFPLISNKVLSLKLSPGRSIARKDSGFLINGPSPYLVVEYDDNEKLTGWVRFKARLKCEKTHLFFYLYYPTGQTVSDHERVLLPCTSEERIDYLFKLPLNYHSLRLEPFATNGVFELSDVSLVKQGSLQVFQFLSKKHFTKALSDPRVFIAKLRKVYAVWREGGLHGLKVRIFANQFTADYQDWVRRYDTLDDTDRKKIVSHIEKLKYKPKISVVVPVYNVAERWLRAAIDSVQRQLYPNWELCIADDASTAPHVKAVLEEYKLKDSRIKVVYREKNGHISEASNTALEAATGEYVALLDNDDELTEHALYMVVNELNDHPDAKFVYSDEDKLTSFGMRFNPYFKSGWNPDLLLSQNYLCHLCVYKRELLQKIGGFRKGFEGAQDWDLALRATDLISEREIRHIPHVLYHWRVIEGSTAQSTGYKPYVLKAQQRSVEEHLQRKGINGAKVEIIESIAQLRVRLPVPKPEPLVTLIVPTRDKHEVLKVCVDGVLKDTTYKNIELIVVDNNSVEKETFAYFEEIQKDKRVRILTDRSPFNYSRLNNKAVKEARGELIGLINNDLEIINREWLSEMVSHAVRTEIGAVGARLLYPNGLIQHAGVILGIGGVGGHNHKGQRRDNPGYFNRAILTQDLSAVTAACLVMRKEIFEKVGGLEEEALAVAFNDVDLCLKVRKLGLRVVYAAYAELYHHESVSRGLETTPEKFMRFEREVDTMKRRWSDVLNNDPYYNPNLTLLTEDFAFAFPPRAHKPWA